MKQTFAKTSTPSMFGITGVGLITSVGHNAASTILSLKSDITRMQEVKLPVKGGFPLVGAPIVGCSEALLRESRLWDLAVQAAAEAIDHSNQAGLPLNSNKCGILWTVPEVERPGFSTRTSPEFKQKFLEKLGINEKDSAWHELSSGHAAGIAALQEAEKIIASGKATFCLIGGADSLIQLRLLRWLEQSNRLKTETNTDGLIPGEAAAFIVVESRAGIEHRRGHALAWIKGMGISQEHATILSDQPCRAQGLTQAVRAALAESDVKNDDVLLIFCDLNGESYRANEWALAAMRIGFSENMELAHPADCIGDIGAATGSLLLACAAINFAKSPFPINALAFSGSENGIRASAILASANETKSTTQSAFPNSRNHSDDSKINKRQESNKKKHEFAIGLYEEHLEEASFLYEQRLALLDDPELTWRDLDDFEQRFEAHIDGLVLGEDLALEVCKQQVSEGDFGELHAALRVFCRQNRLDLILETIEQIDPEDAEKIQAAGDALNHELPEKWHHDFIGLLSEKNPVLVQIVPKLLGYRRVNAGPALLQALEQSEAKVKSTLLWALGRLREPKARVPLFNGYLQREDDSVRAASALALLRLGEPQTVTYCLRQARSQNWPLLSLGLGGGPSAVSVLLEIAAGEKATVDCLLPLGLLGDISAVETLLAQFAQKDRAESAAAALNLITGAGISEEVFIPEEIDEDELFEDELEKLKRGESLTPPGEKPRGTTITRVSQKPEEWRKWWMANKSRFNPQVRYRLGKPYSPVTLLETLESEKSPRPIRQLAYEELVIRYGVDFPFETDMFVAQQKQALAKYMEWVNANANRFQVGKWYFSGQVMAS